MNLKDAIEKLGQIVANFNKVDEPIENKPENVSETFKDVKLIDGVTIVSYDGDMPMQGMPLFIMTPEGRLPAPDAEYELEDGSKITTIGGLISEVTAVDQPVEPTDVPAPDATAAPAVPNTPAANGDVKPKRVIKSQVEEHVFNSYKDEVAAKFAEFESKFEAISKENVELKEKLSTAMQLNSQLVEVVKEMADEPAAKPTEKAGAFDVSAARKAFKEDLKKLELSFNK